MLGYKPHRNELFRGIPMREWQVLLASALDLSVEETAKLMFLSMSWVKGLSNNLTKRIGLTTINWAVVRSLHEAERGDVRRPVLTTTVQAGVRTFRAGGAGPAV